MCLQQPSLDDIDLAEPCRQSTPRGPERDGNDRLDREIPLGCLMVY